MHARIWTTVGIVATVSVISVPAQQPVSSRPASRATTSALGDRLMHPEIPSKPGFTAPRYSGEQDHLLDRLAVLMRLEAPTTRIR